MVQSLEYFYYFFITQVTFFCHGDNVTGQLVELL